MGILKENLEVEALKLPSGKRAELAHRLIDSLEDPGAGDFEAEWIEEAERRYAEYRKGLTPTRPAEQVFREAKARLD